MYSDEKEAKSASKNSKWLEYELAIQKFNTAVPYFVDMLTSNHGNIMKLKRLNQTAEIQKQWMSASKTVTQLTSLLSEMNNLRSQVSETDIKKFDRLISSSRQSALSAIKSHQNFPIRAGTVKATNKQDENLVVEIDQQLQVVANLSNDLREQELSAAKLERLEEDIENVHSLYQDLAQLVHQQEESIEKVENLVETTHHNVIKGEESLCRAANLKRGMYPVIGAVVGCVLGGPLGLYAGFKIGGMSAMFGSFIGYTGGKMLKNQNQEAINAAEKNREMIAT